MSEAAPAGHEVKIVNISEDHSYHLDVEELKKILLRDDIKDVPVALVSVAGPYRGGKSFILNFFLRYLKATQSARDDGSWLGTDDEELVGFSWRGGSVRNTTGMLLWSEPLFCTDAAGKKVAVLLMDTQGTFDKSSSVRDCSTIFALSCLVSSLQIYNIFTNVREDDLQQLELFVEYGKLLKDEDGKPFQVLEFLVRDWPYPYEFEYGVEGGRLFIEDKLKIDPEQPQELQGIRNHIKSSFEKISCFLMPSPGDKVGRKVFKGQLKDINQGFKDCLKELASSIFSPDKLNVKQLHGETLVASDLLVYFQTYMNMFNSGSVPSPTTIWEATSTASVEIATKKANEAYEQRMQHDTATSMTESALREVHRVAQDLALAMFRDTKKIASETIVHTAVENLRKEYDSRLLSYMSVNFAKTLQAKNLSHDAFNKYVTDNTSTPLCVNPVQLEEVFTKAIDAGLKVFDANRRASTNDGDRLDLKTSLEQNLPALRMTNDQNNKVGVNVIRNWYWDQMYNRVLKGSAVTREQLSRYHGNYLNLALKRFNDDYRKSSKTISEDTYVDSLKKKIADSYATLYEANEHKLESERQWREKVENERRYRERLLQQERERFWREQEMLRREEERIRKEQEENNKRKCTIL